MARGTLWSGVDKFGGMALQFISNLVLARILMPSDYGAIGMLMIFIAVSQVIIDGGFGSALIQKNRRRRPITPRSFSGVWVSERCCISYSSSAPR